MRLKIAASLLSADFSRLGEEVKNAEEGVDLIHWDIMDGHFVPNITFGPAVVQALRDKTKLPFNAHLMIEKPYNFIEKFAEAGSDIVLRLPQAHLPLQLLEKSLPPQIPRNSHIG